MLVKYWMVDIDIDGIMLFPSVLKCAGTSLSYGGSCHLLYNIIDNDTNYRSLLASFTLEGLSALNSPEYTPEFSNAYHMYLSTAGSFEL